MNSIDTNVALRFLLNDVPAHSAKARVLLASPPVYISDVAIVETAYVLEKALGFGRNQVAPLLRVLISIPGLVYSDHLFPAVIDLYEHKPALSIVDCYGATEAGMFGANLYTFDKKLRNQGGTHVLTP